VTPWQKVYKKLGLNASELAREIERDRSKVTRAINDPAGLINGRDQAALVEVAKRKGISLSLEDMLPDDKG